jgi:di/tricarboxylate transporter
MPTFTPAHASLIALLVAIVLSCTSQLNVGLLALAFAWLIGVFVAGWPADVVAAGFPTQLFLMLAGVTLLFAVSDANGTINALAERALGLARGSARRLPWVLFLIAMTLSTLGPGAVPSVALIAPIAMVLGARSGVPPFLTALMVANGANAGNLSPLSAVGVIANSRMADVGLGGHEWKVWFANFAAHLLVAGGAWLLLGGLAGGRAPAGGRGEAPQGHGGSAQTPVAARASPGPDASGRGVVATEPSAHDRAPRATATGALPPLTSAQRLTVVVVALWIVAVVGLGVHLGFAAFTAAVILIVLRAADEASAVKRMPWAAILMVCGVSLLVAVLEKSGGMDLFTGLLARVVGPGSLNGAIAFVTGVISTYSSTSGVVLPTFLPTVPSLVERVGGGDALAVALSVNVGASLVDVSPLSTIGALCVAAVGDPAGARQLFRQLLVWGLTMTVAGAFICQLVAGPLARL